LNQIFEDDQERIEALAQWFGYNLTWDNTQQKFVMFVGPPRSGKGTTMLVMNHMLGAHNVANPALTSLGGRFGLAPLIGKQAAIVGDGHVGGSSNSLGVLERLKSVIGGDPQNVDRKGRDEITNVSLKARFTIAVNELPRLSDASAALRSRIIIIPFNVSFEGKEDYGLLPRLLTEIPGITNWALAGLRDLRNTGKLLQPKAGDNIRHDFARLSSPVQAFIEDCAELRQDEKFPVTHLQAAWQMWCEENGHMSGSMESLGVKLRAAAPGVKRTRLHSEGVLIYFYQGIALNTEMAGKVHVRLKG
jgi:putative DNA primase/helicase